jgi:DNA-binding NarL/FixJ family response regulator
VRAVRVVVADDHGLVRAGLRALIDGLSGIEVVGEAANGREALARITALRPDVALVNISMPELNGLETLARAARKRLRTRILVFSMHADEEYVRRAFALGAAGYLVKNAERAELDMAIRAVARGDVWISPAVTKSATAALAAGLRLRDGAGADGERGPLERLTSRQREVLQLVAEGLTTKEIAARIGVSTKTVDAHRAQLMDRLGVRGVPALVRYAMRYQLVTR